MKILAINGTPHSGNTWSWAKYFKNEYTDQIEFSEIHLNKENIPFCMGCNICLEKGEEKCPHSEQVQAIADKMSDADGIIIVSSAYSLGVNAVLKNFIDHMSYNFHRPNYPYKKALVITSAAGMGQKEVAKYLNEVLGHWNFNKVFNYTFKSSALRGFEPNEQQKKKFNKTADRFLHDVASGKLHSPSLKRLFYFGVWKAMSKMNDYDDSADARFWTDNNMYGLNYHNDVEFGSFKKMMAKLMHGMMDRVFKRNNKK